MVQVHYRSFFSRQAFETRETAKKDLIIAEASYKMIKYSELEPFRYQTLNEFSTISIQVRKPRSTSKRDSVIRKVGLIG